MTANLVQKGIRQAVESVKSGVERLKNDQETSRPTFTADTAVYDKRSATFHRDHVSLSTPDGRIECNYILPDDVDVPPTKYVTDEDYEFRRATLHMEAGDHASFPSHPERCGRSAASAGKETAEVSGVQSTADRESGEQDVVSGRQTPASQHRSPPLTVTRDGTTRGGLPQTHSGNTGLRWPSASITEWCLLARITADHGAMLSNPTEN